MIDRQDIGLMKESSEKVFASELQEHVAQVLSLVKMNLHEYIDSLQDPSSADQLHPLNKLLGQAISDLRDISYTLESGSIRRVGLIAAIRDELGKVRAGQPSLDYTFLITGEPFTLLPEQELLIFRIMQDALDGMAKVPGSTSIHVELKYSQPSLELIVTDDNAGNTITVESDFWDLYAMKQRALFIDGVLEVQKAGRGKSNRMRLSLAH